MIEDHGCRIEMSLPCCPHQPRHIPGAPPIHVGPLRQQIFGGIRPSEPAGKLERRPEFGLRYGAAFNELPRQVEHAQAGGHRDGLHLGAETHQGGCRLGISELEGQTYRRAVPVDSIHFGTRLDEYLDQFGRDAAIVWMNTRHQRQHGRVSGLSEPAQGLHLGAGIQQKPRDLRCIGGRPLAKVLHTVGGQVIQQRRPMFTAGARMRQRRIPDQERLEFREIPVDHRIGRDLELRPFISLARVPFDEAAKCVPTLEAVGPRNEKLRVDKPEFPATLSRLLLHFTCAFFNFADGPFVAAPHKIRQVGSGDTDKLVQPLAAPLLYSVCSLGSGYLNEFFRPFHVICEIGTCR